MADKTSLIITATDAAGKTQQKSVTDVNPNAADEHILTFAQMTNALTTDTYQKSTLIIRRELDEEA